MRPVAYVADTDTDEVITFTEFHTLVAPAMRDAARGALARARHGGRVCRGVSGTRWCPECEADLDDLLLNSFVRLRTALSGPVPRTRSGEPVRELAALRAHLTGPGARGQDTAALAAQLRRPADDTEPPWLRAARAQLVHYPLTHLEERTRRADAVRRGAAARPDRDLRTAGWAAPLRADPVDLDLLLVAVFRARRGVTDLRDVPSNLRERHGLSVPQADRRMAAALARLRAVNPGFFAANIAGPAAVGTAAVGPMPADDPQEWLRAFAAQETARATLSRLFGPRPGEPATRGRRRAGYRAVASAVCAADAGGAGDPVGAACRSLGLPPAKAARLVRRLASLIAAAGPEWTARAAAEPPPTIRPPRRAGRRPARRA